MTSVAFCQAREPMVIIPAFVPRGIQVVVGQIGRRGSKEGFSRMSVAGSQQCCSCLRVGLTALHATRHYARFRDLHVSESVPFLPGPAVCDQRSGTVASRVLEPHYCLCRTGVSVPAGWMLNTCLGSKNALVAQVSCTSYCLRSRGLQVCGWW